MARAKGVTINRKLKKMGMHSSDTAEIFFDDVRVPQKNLVGEEGKGFIYQMMQFQEERLYAAIAGYTGCELAINETINYTRQRKTFGKPILDNQIVHYKLSELMTEVEALKALTWKGIEIHVNGGDCTKLASMSKLKPHDFLEKLTTNAYNIGVEWVIWMSHLFQERIEMDV